MAIFNNISDVSHRSILLVELLCCMHINELLSVKSAVQVNKYTNKKSCRQKGSRDWLTDECLSLRLLDGEIILSLAQATTTTSNKFLFIGSSTNVNI
jgi:hypothetical protein